MANDLFIEKDLYNIGQNKGFLEFGLHPEALAANVTNQYSFNNGGLLNATAGASYLPNNKNVINPRAVIDYQDQSGLYIKALVDEYQKSLQGKVGNFSGNITKTADNELIKQIDLQGQNFGASFTDSKAGKAFGLNAMLNNIMGGNVSANAYKDDYGSGAGVKYEVDTEDLITYLNRAIQQ
jgi:hypothetical protein